MMRQSVTLARSLRNLQAHRDRTLLIGFEVYKKENNKVK